MKNNEFVYKLYHYSSYLNYALYWFEGNALFLLINFPLILALLGLDWRLSTVPIFFVCIQTVIPSLYALTETLIKVRVTNGIVVPFFKALKEGFRKLFLKALPITGLVTLIMLNLTMTSQYATMQILWWANVVFLFFMIAFILNFTIVFATWHQSVRDAALLTLKLSIVKSIRYYLNLIIVLGTFIALRIISVYIVLIGVALALQLCLINFRPVIEFVNQRPENSQD